MAIAKERVLGWIAAAAVLFGQGCAPPPEPDESIAQTGDEVVGGTPDNGTPPLYPEVGFLRIPASGTVCSGTLISPFTILTARHCFQTDGFNAA